MNHAFLYKTRGFYIVKKKIEKFIFHLENKLDNYKMNNMDIRCGELQSVIVNLNFWEQVWSDWNDGKELEFKPAKMRLSFHKELNDAMTTAYENNYNNEDKYIVVDNLVQEYLNGKWIKIVARAESQGET